VGKIPIANNGASSLCFYGFRLPFNYPVSALRGMARIKTRGYESSEPGLMEVEDCRDLAKNVYQNHEGTVVTSNRNMALR
jgi:hypothetical protein